MSTTSRLEKLQAFLSDSPNDAFLLFALAKEYEGLSQPKKALETYLTLQQADANYVGLYYHLAKLYEQLELPEKAWATYCTGMEVARAAGDQHALSELMGARLNLGDEEDFE